MGLTAQSSVQLQLFLRVQSVTIEKLNSASGGYTAFSVIIHLSIMYLL